MANIPKVTVMQNNNNIKLVFNIKKDGRVETIIGANISLIFKESTKNIEFTRDCTIADATTAEVTYTLTKEDLAESGVYLTEMIIKYPNETILSTLNPFILNVTPELS